MNNIKTLFPILLLMPLMWGCMDSGETEIEDTVSGIYYLYGPRTTVEDPCTRCTAEQDSLREIISFSVIARLDHDNRERIRLYGVQGADTGEFGKRVYPDCTHSEDCKVFGYIVPSGEFVVNGGAFEIDIENNGRRYKATGSLGTSTIDLKGQYSYKGITIDYDLNGKRVYLTID